MRIISGQDSAETHASVFKVLVPCGRGVDFQAGEHVMLRECLWRLNWLMSCPRRCSVRPSSAWSLAVASSQKHRRALHDLRTHLCAGGLESPEARV